QRVDLEAGVLAEREELRRARRPDRLRARVLLERLAGLVEVTHLGMRVECLERERPALFRQELAQLGEHARVPRRDEEPVHASRPRAWIARSSPMPSSATSSSWSSVLRSKVPPSAVPCTSTRRPLPVATTFMSTSARESSTYARSSRTSPAS